MTNDNNNNNNSDIDNLGCKRNARKMDYEWIGPLLNHNKKILRIDFGC